MTRTWIALFSLFVISNGSLAADSPEYPSPPNAPHAFTYNKINSSPGQIVTINGFQFRSVRIPFVDYSGGRYALTYLFGECPSPYDRCFYSQVSYYHTTESLTPQLTIEGYPAKIDQYELRDPEVSPWDTDWLFSTTQQNRYYVTIDVGDAWLVLMLDYYEPSAAELLTDPNAVPSTRWWQLEEDASLNRTFDWWIDYIRIYQFP